MSRSVSLRRLPLLTLIKLGLIGTISAALLLLAVMGVLRLVLPAAPDPYANAPADVKVIIWVFYLVIGPVFAGLFFAFSCWLGVAVLSRLGLVRLRVEIRDEPDPDA